MAQTQVAPEVDGIALDEGCGISIEPDKEMFADEFLVDICSPVVCIPRPRPLVAWLTKRDHRGHYEKVRRLKPGSRVVMVIDDETIEFCDGTGTIKRST